MFEKTARPLVVQIFSSYILSQALSLITPP
jgi:hypothetical protein